MLRQYRMRMDSEKRMKRYSGEVISHGRGGAGNINGSATAGTSAQDLTTPTIKSDVYTTGRGGSGNMAHSDPSNPDIARQSQDVQPQPVRDSSSDFHVGRGGAANVGKPVSQEALSGKLSEARWQSEAKSQSSGESAGRDPRGWADKGKELLFGRKKK
ncbi:MAG: hypothetical protein M1817_001796 [Caeruleum heppii]|nr:MAG: hypothetical protein M1817_001796 [Caeruleum heppii]